MRHKISTLTSTNVVILTAVDLAGRNANRSAAIIGPPIGLR